MTRLFVTGANGHLSRATLRHLLETQKIAPSDMIAGSRDPAKLAEVSKLGVETRKADFDDREGLVAAFAGIDRLLIVSTDELATPGKRLEQHRNAVEAAASAGVGHVVYTSMPNPDRSLVTFAPDHLGTEEAIKASGLPYTILRNTWYADNYLMAMPHNLQAGSWYTAMGGGQVSNISRDDCARAAAAALAKPPAGNATLTLTGPESLSASEIAAIVSAVAGKPLQVVPVSDDQFAGGMKAAGLSDFVIAMLVSADANIRAGNFDLVTNDFEMLTGARPQSLRAFFEDHRATLA
jgi:NAD(P)H dehydrogenase (quinone)